MPPITSRDARHAYETESALRLSASERSRLAQYLANAQTTAESHYVDTTNSLVKTSIEAMHKLQNIDTLESVKSSEDTSSIVPTETLLEKAPKPAKTKQQATPSKTPNPVESKERFYKIILDKFMMTADKELPSNNELRRCIDATSGCESLTNEDIKRIRTRLECKRLPLRVEEVAACFPRSEPQESQVLNILERKGWLNQRTVDIITKTWKPCERRGQTT
ncbi:hypothetical protein ACJMK2_037015 [Sinanodonta woodiana]|uniref:Uncharacterized protein n=1 Tax=Sinanodonta woodiana TaxID=1069815 RepID=A0ABD3WMG3_SINWO